MKQSPFKNGLQGQRIVRTRRSVSKHMQDADELVLDLLALVNAGYVEVRRDGFGPARYGLPAGRSTPHGEAATGVLDAG